MLDYEKNMSCYIGLSICEKNLIYLKEITKKIFPIKKT